MVATSAEPKTFWRRLCLVLAAIAVIEAIALASTFRHATAADSSTPHDLGAAAASRKVGTANNFSAPLPDPGSGVASPEASADPLASALTARGMRRRTRGLEDLGSTLGRTDPEAALSTLGELQNKSDRAALARGIFDALARLDPARALAYAKRTQAGTDREAALTALLNRWSTSTDDSPENRAKRIAHYGLDAGLGFELLDGNSPRPDLAVLWADNLSSGKSRAEMLGQAAAAQVASDPLLAISYGHNLTGSDLTDFNERLVGAWTRLQPDAAWQWTNTLTDPAARTQAQGVAVTALSDLNPEAAAAELAWLPAGAVRQNAVAEVAANFALRNTDGALTWAETLPAADVPIAGNAINSVAPVGIGAQLRVDDQGYPVIQALLPNAAAIQSGQVHEGDRIVGISQGDGSFLDVQQLDLNKVVNLVRGAAGSSVQFQVASALPDGGFSAPTVVTIVRQRIKHGS